MKTNKSSVVSINRVSFKEKLTTYLRHPGSFAVFLLCWAAILATVFVLLYLIVYILVNGIPHLTPELFAWKYTSDNVSVVPSIITTLYMTALSLLVAVPLGIGCSVYLMSEFKFWSIGKASSIRWWRFATVA